MKSWGVVDLLLFNNTWMKHIELLPAVNGCVELQATSVDTHMSMFCHLFCLLNLTGIMYKLDISHTRVSSCLHGQQANNVRQRIKII